MIGCQPCAMVATAGYFGDTVDQRDTHCLDCHIDYPGTSNRWGHCARCHGTFRGVSSFDAHQRHDDNGEYTRECLCSVLLVGQSEPFEVFAVSDTTKLVLRQHGRLSQLWFWGGEDR